MSVVHVTGKARRWLSSGHPWVYRDDIAEVEAEPGDLAAVVDPAGAPLGWAFVSTHSRIALRFVSRGAERPDRAFFAARVQRAVAARLHAGYLDPRGACRLIAGDADLLPGFVLDRYADVLVAQCGTLAADRHRDLFVELVRAALPFSISCVFDRSDASARKLEGLEQHIEIVDGALPEELVVHEREFSWAVDVKRGHKTGHYLDQRDNRARAAEFAHGVDVLDAFSYDGLFGIRAALAGAKSVVCVDQSQEALERAAKNAERNGVRAKMTFERANCMHDLRARAERKESFGLVIVDPPAFAKSRREVQGAERGYVELNRRAFEITAPGGMVVSASCSYNVRAADFQSHLARAAHKAQRPAWLEEFRGAGADHPVLLTLPETNYLKCAFVRVG